MELTVDMDGVMDSPTAGNKQFPNNESATPLGFHNTKITSVARVYEGSQKKGPEKQVKTEGVHKQRLILLRPLDRCKNHVLTIF